MTVNPIALTRLLSNLALVAVIATFALFTLVLKRGPDGAAWAMTIAAVAITAILAQIAVFLIWPRAIVPAWDEQVQTSHRASCAFGYWAVVATFLALFAPVQTGALSAHARFFLIAPVLAAAPALFMVFAGLRGRAGYTHGLCPGTGVLPLAKRGLPRPPLP